VLEAKCKRIADFEIVSRVQSQQHIEVDTVRSRWSYKGIVGRRNPTWEAERQGGWHCYQSALAASPDGMWAVISLEMRLHKALKNIEAPEFQELLLRMVRAPTRWWLVALLLVALYSPNSCSIERNSHEPSEFGQTRGGCVLS
jgi:hypothetical protein